MHGRRKGWLQNMSEDMNSSSKNQIDRSYSGGEVQSSGSDGHNVYSRTTSDPHGGESGTLLCSIIPSKADHGGKL